VDSDAKMRHEGRLRDSKQKDSKSSSYRAREAGDELLSSVSFVAGQPLGYHASWPLFTLSHHMVIWWAAEQVYPGVRFDRYAILGDDVLICDENVAQVYASVLEEFGVQISLSKSLISKTGCAEFAKRFLVNELRLDLSPISSRCLSNFSHPYGLYAIRMMYPMKRFSTYCRIGGMGYRNLGRLHSNRCASYRRMRLLWDKPNYPMDWWLGGGL